jgi:exonuclease III
MVRRAHSSCAPNTIYNYGTDVIFLCDTRMNGKGLNISEKFSLRYKVYANSTRNSRGVAVLISNQVHHEVLKTIRDPEENFLLIRLVIKEREVVFGSVYGPNTDNGSKNFFDSLCLHLQRWNGRTCIFGGDFNATYSNLGVNENPDVLFMRNVPSRIRSDQVVEMCRVLDMSDPFRTSNGKTSIVY